MHRKALWTVLLAWTLVAPSHARAGQRQVVAVFDIQTKFTKLSRAKRNALTDVLAGEMALGGVFQVMPPGDVKRILLDQSRVSFKACYDEKCQIQLGRELPANKLLTCTVVRIGRTCRVSASLYDLKRQTTDTSERETAGCGEQALVSSIEKVTTRLREWGKAQAGAKPSAARVEADRAIGEKPVAWTPSVRQAWLSVSSQPSGLGVWLDGAKSGVTPLNKKRLEPGSHEVLIRSPCHYDSGKRFSLAQDETKQIELRLLEKMGAVYVDAKTQEGYSIDADVFVDNKRVGKGPGPHRVSVCAQHLEVRHPKQGRWASRLNIEERQVHRFEASLSARPQFPELSVGKDYDPMAHALIAPTINSLRSRYYPKSRLKAADMLEGALKTLGDHHPAVTFQRIRQGTFRVVNRDAGSKTLDLTVNQIGSLTAALGRLVDLAQTGLSKTDQTALEFVALNGALSRLDSHTRILKPSVMKELEISTRGQFGGVGVVIRVQDDQLQVVSPVEGTPAWRAGIKAMDRIVRIEGQPTKGLKLEQAVNLMRGKPGTKLAFHIMRQGWNAPQKIAVVREIIKVKSAEGRRLVGDIGVLRVRSFGKNCAQDALNIIAELKKTGPLKGLILDLRGNPGGLLSDAVALADIFLAQGNIITTKTTGKQDENRASASPTDELNLPMIVLADRGSASASELVLGSLKNLNRALQLGERTFGKGSLQVLYSLKHNFAFKMTIGEYLAAGNASFEKTGFDPDIVLLPFNKGETPPTDRLGIPYPVEDQSTENDFARDLAVRILQAYGKPTRLGTLDAAAGLLQQLYNQR